MKEQDAEARLARAMEDAAPDRLDELLEVREEARRQEKIVDISAPPRKKRRRWQNFAAAVAAALVLVIGGGSFFGWRYANAPDSLVDIDVNPSVQLTVSRNEKVLSCEALNADGAEIIDGMDLRGAQLNVAVNALIGSMVQHGYIDELKNSVLITVANEDAARAQALQERLMADVNGLLAGESVDASVMAQTITTRDQSLAGQAEAYGISEGKAALIQRILDTDPTLTFEALAGLSVNDLSLLLQAKQADTSGMTVTGQASDKAYIGLEKATEIALAQLPGAALRRSSLTTMTAWSTRRSCGRTATSTASRLMPLPEQWSNGSTRRMTTGPGPIRAVLRPEPSPAAPERRPRPVPSLLPAPSPPRASSRRTLSAIRRPRTWCWPRFPAQP